MLETDTAAVMANTTVFLKDYTKPDYLIPNVVLNFTLGSDSSLVVAELEIERRQGVENSSLVLDGEKFELIELKLNGQTIDQHHYTVNERSLTIDEVPEKFSLQITTKLLPHQNSELSGLYQSSGNFCTQCEAEGFRRITYFLDRPDVLSRYEVNITADKTACPVLLSNGNPVARGDNSDGTHWHRWQDPHPKPSYLFALVAGDLECISDSFQTGSEQEVKLNIYTQAHNIDKCGHAMASLKNSMLWDEQVYGREYDLDVYNIVAVDDFNMGAMENKGLNIFNSKYVLADIQTATDLDYQGIESVIGHEYFHNWSGNRVTCRDWFQLSLKEGFTVFRDQEFSADMGSRAVKRIRDVQTLRTYQFKEDDGPMAHPIRPESYQEINNFYTVTIYEKGAEVIRMMHRLLGRELFRQGTDYYFQRYDGQAVTTEDFVRSMEKVSGVDLEQFRYWYTQAGTPRVSVEQDYDSGRGVLSLTFTQSCPPSPGQAHKEHFQIPISIALFNAVGEKILEKTVVLSKETERFDFGDLVDKPVVSMLRDFSAPIKLKFAQSEEDLVHLVQFDDNGFTRWEAMQQLILNVLMPAIRQEAQNFDEAPYQALRAVFSSLLEQVEQDPSIQAEMLRLPSLSYLAEQSKPINPAIVTTLREKLLKRLAKELEPEFAGIYSATQPGEADPIGSSEVSKRELKNCCLSYLIATAKAENYRLAQDQYESATNMTDRIAAFTGLIHSDYDKRPEIIANFYSAWQSEQLVLDKWFTVQATASQGLSEDSDAIESVLSLMNHSAFSLKNPNKVRSLIGAFTSNMRAFHAVDGRGYKLLADVVIELNAINPQIGARLVSVFNNWRAYCDPFAHNMRVQLERIERIPNLSKDVSEIVGKALA